MSPPGIDELLQREIDGVNSPAESALLGERLAADTRLADRFASLGRASAALTGAGRIAPPRELVDDVMRATRRLDADHGIACRAGLHCAPWAHTTIGTLSSGTVRFSPGPFNTPADIDAALAAVREIVAGLPDAPPS